ncbi:MULTISPECIES: hypothetical protein [Chryseobacterium]|jgi:hypothetical protein|uniref:hypothetical protein n=1 Tax=Chryseobacterium TaxID=59732 RepID=UPI00054D11F6|nr:MULTISPECIES: hypothetical protein [Chryseobacterium]MDR6156881.1 hypothetical protein [Chryseobacterium sp. SLBN-27]
MKTDSIKTRKVKTDNTFFLIKGIFSPEDAKEILSKIYNFKINYHNLNNWRSLERFGIDDENSQKRIPKLKNDKAKIEELIDHGKAREQKIRINAEISISFCEKT